MAEKFHCAVVRDSARIAAPISAAESRFHMRANAPSSTMSEAHFGPAGGRIPRCFEEADSGQAVGHGAPQPPGAVGVPGSRAVGFSDGSGETAQLPFVSICELTK